MEHTITSENGTMTVYLRGEMDHHNAVPLREEIDAAITFETPATLKLDLSDIAFCDSSGLGFIMGRYRRMNESGGETVLINPSEPTMKILRLAGVEKLIKTETTKGAAT
ncbi:MAG: STAS domain-containing protein [Clostridia bacterium]|nr:STAS domain-containing protein [Clostridia bacterium]